MRVRVLLRFQLGIAAAVVFSSGLCPLTPAVAQGGAPEGPPLTTLVSLQDAFSQVADQVEPAVVTVSSYKTVRGDDLPRSLAPFERGPRRATGTGSGVIIYKDGWILTNDHVVDGADRVTVKLHDGREFTGVVSRDPRSDLALVKIKTPGDLPVARLGDSDRLKIGHWAIAIGSPYRFEGTLSVGVISSLNRRQEIIDGDSGGRTRLYPSMIQTDAAINPGNSGGPLCNISGEVIGINTAIESDHSGTGGGGSIGIGFAIPINLAKFVVAQLKEFGHVSYGYLGISPTTVTPRLASALRVEHGALVEQEPLKDSPAGKAGFMAGDVITEISSHVINTELDLRTLVAQTAPGTTVDISIVRDGKPMMLKAKLEEAEAREIARPRTTARSDAQLGIEVIAFTKRASEGSIKSDAGVLIKAIGPGSSALDSEELTEGCVITRVNDTPTPTIQAFQQVTAHLRSGDHLRIHYLKPQEQQDPGEHFEVIDVD